jgi:hypothetical protein
MSSNHKRPYTLTLTADERRAIDWIGGRYATGDDLRDRLLDSIELRDDTDDLPPTIWNERGEVTFSLTEADAWEVRELCEQEEFLFPCFSAELTAKLQALCDSIV